MDILWTIVIGLLAGALAGFIAATLGAVVILAIYRMIRRRQVG